MILFYDASHAGEMMVRFPVFYIAILRLGLMAWATYLLFTPEARLWFAARPPAPPSDDPPRHRH